jgi:hypothetical protein
MAELSTIKKYMKIIETLNARLDKTLTSYDDELQKELGVGQKQLGRLLDELAEHFDNIVLLDGLKRKTYKLIKPIDIFVEAFENSNEIGWFFNMAHEADPEIFKELENFTNSQKHIYMFKNTPFEDVSSLESKITFKRLKTAVELHEYRDIKYYFDDQVYKNLKCLKLIFMDNNWYIAYVDEDEILKFGRISFIEEVNYSKGKNSFQPNSVKKQLAFIENSLQNSMTLFDKEKKTATLKAHPPIAKYFEKDMKKFLSTQKFIKKQNDGSIIFTADYTQELEILPFVQKWLPDLEILKPKSLIKIYKNKLQKAMGLYKET